MREDKLIDNELFSPDAEFPRTELPVKVDILSRYLAEIDRFPLLTPEEEHSLAVRYKETGDPNIAHKLVTSNLRFVVMVALEYRHYGFRLMDLIQEGNVGLMMAVKKFDPYKGFRLITYAVWWIRAFILNYILKNWSLVKVGTTQEQRRLFFKLSKLRALLDNENAEQKKVAVKTLGVDEDELEEIENRYLKRDLSLDEPLSNESEKTQMDILPVQDKNVEEEFLHQEDHELLKAGINIALSGLPERERYIIENRYLSENPVTLQEIGEKLGLSRERVRQLESRALKRIKATLKKYGFHTDTVTLSSVNPALPLKS
jgi:RNA polymerase sigma-32 factor